MTKTNSSHAIYVTKHSKLSKRKLITYENFTHIRRNIVYVQCARTVVKKNQAFLKKTDGEDNDNDDNSSLKKSTVKPSEKTLDDGDDPSEDEPKKSEESDSSSGEEDDSDNEDGSGGSSIEGKIKQLLPQLESIQQSFQNRYCVFFRPLTIC